MVSELRPAVLMIKSADQNPFGVYNPVILPFLTLIRWTGWPNIKRTPLACAFSAAAKAAS